MTIYLLRHGRTEFNDRRRYQGMLDIPLSEAGRAELCAADFSPRLVYVSPLLRARQTAAVLFPNARQEAVPGLEEMDFGDFDGRTADEMADDPAYRAWVDGGCTGRCPNGEDRAEFCARVCAAFDKLLERAAARGDERLVIVAHGGTQRAVMSCCSLPESDYFAILPPNGGGYVLDYDAALWAEKKKLRLLETVSYVKGGAPC